MSKFSQTFSYIEPEYKLNVKENKLEKIGNKDLSAMLNSNLDCALDKIIAKYGFLPTQSPVNLIDGVGNVENFDDDLQELQEICDVAEDYREKFGLAEDVSIEKIYQLVAQASNCLKSKLQGSVSRETKVEVPSVKSEVENGETK